MREIEMTARTVEEAVEAACAALGVDRDDLGVSYEVVEFPARKLFKTIPAKVRVTLEEPEDETPVAPPAPQPAAPAAPAAVPQPAAPAQPEAKPESKPEAGAEKPAPADETEVELDLAADPRLQAAVDYLTPIFTLMGAESFQFAAFQKGEATILRVSGEHMGVLIGRRGETMESLSYLASLVVNRMEGPYVKLGIDVGGYRGKRESDLTALAGRLAQRVIKTGCYYEMETMNPYERHIIHTAVAEIEGVRSESKGDGKDRHVVLYSTDPNASNLPDRESQRNNSRGRTGAPRGDRGGYRGGAPRSGGYRSDRGPARSGERSNDRNNDRGGYRGGPRSGGYHNDRGPRGPRPSSVPGREFANAPRDENLRPQAPSRTERIRDGEDMDLDLFGKIEL